mmetsp:Transcript_22972/g.42254  ORF Transcript_22972/g.42254 Transcript_22972/m.42254 type:complete len:352 (+) Transcript_22972:83-1138(+)
MSVDSAYVFSGGAAGLSQASTQESTSLKASDLGQLADLLPEDTGAGKGKQQRQIPIEGLEAKDVEAFAQEMFQFDDSGSSVSSICGRRNFDEWSASSSEVEAIPLRDLMQNVPVSCRLAAVALARAGARAEDDHCDERPVTDWLTTVELHLLPDELVQQALHAGPPEHSGRSAVRGGSALPFAARYAITESSALRKQRGKMRLELRSLSRAAGGATLETALPTAAMHSADGILDGLQEEQIPGDAFGALSRENSDEFPSLPLVASAAPLILPMSTRDMITCVVDEHKLDLLNEDSGDDDPRNGGKPRRPRGHCGGCGYWRDFGVTPWLRPSCMNSPGQSVADEVQQQLIRL